MNFKKLFGTNFAPGRRPYAVLGIERVSPDAREDGSDPDDYTRVSGEFKWRFYPERIIVVDIDWEAIYILDDDDADAMMLDQFQDRLDLSVSFKLAKSKEFRPVLRFTRGETAPAFEFVEEVFAGFVWDRMFKAD